MVKNNKAYSAKMKDPRWQKKRLQIFERDGWKCRLCGDDKSTLHVHHTFYKKENDPWDYPDINLLTLCENCYNYEHNQAFDDLKDMINSWKQNAGITVKEIFNFFDDMSIFPFRSRDDMKKFVSFILHIQHKQYIEGLTHSPEDYYKVYSGKTLEIHEKPKEIEE